jgi:cytochrome c biogenesis protein CcmG/thiol:disulfide interchange protein DsbE
MRIRLFAAALVLAACCAGCDRGEHPQQLNTPAPMFAVADAHHSFDLSKERGHLVLLNFWASWCAPCLEELPSMEALHQQLPQLEMVGVSFDEDTTAYQNFVDMHHVGFLTVVDPEQRVNTMYGTFRPPESYVIDQHGMVRRKFIGAQDWSSPNMVDYFRKLMAQK